MKEIFIIGIVLLGIVCSSIFINNYLENTSKILINDLKQLENNIGQSDSSQKELMEKSKEIYSKWGRINSKWSNIILHEEIDAIETSLIRIKEKIKIGKIDESIEDIETAIFLVNHIKEKEKISLKNIF